MKSRSGLIDEIRGIAVIIMVVFHFIYQVNLWTGAMENLINNFYINLLKTAAQVIFITIAGMCCNYSRDNVKRGLVYVYIGLFINFITLIIVPEDKITFGIFSFMGVSILVYEIIRDKLKNLNIKIGAVIFIVLYLIFYKIQYIGVLMDKYPYKDLIESGCLNFMGIKSSSFISSDFFPILPWIFLFMTGVLIGKEYYKLETKNIINIKLLEFIGRNSLFIYLIHIPILIFIINFRSMFL